MVILEVDNSYSRVIGLPVVYEKELRQLLSYVIGGSNSYYRRFGHKRRSLLDKSGSFPSGLKHRVIKFLQKNEIFFEIKERRVKPK